jgi:trigger factor
MNIEIEEVDYCKVKVTYTASTDVVKKTTDEAIGKFKNFRIPGFRPGRATSDAIMVKFKDSINQIVSEKLFEEAFSDTLFETKLIPIGKPQVESYKLTKDSFQCVLQILKSPEFELKTVVGMEVPEPHIEKTSDDLFESTLQTIRDAYKEVVPYEDDQFVQAGDKVTLDYTLSNGEKDEGQLYTVGDCLFPEFDENLYGMKAGEEKTFEVTSDMEGKVEKLQCTVLIHMGMKSIPATINDELAVKCGFKDVEELDKTIRTSTEIRYKAVKDDLIGEQIKSKIIADYDFRCPEWLVDMEAKYLCMITGDDFEQLSDEDKSVSLKNAENNVRFTIVLDAIRRAYPDSELSDSESLGFVKSLLLQKGAKNVDRYLQQSANDGSIYGLIARAKNEYTMKWITDNVKVIS